MGMYESILLDLVYLLFFGMPDRLDVGLSVMVAIRKVLVQGKHLIMHKNSHFVQNVKMFRESYVDFASSLVTLDQTAADDDSICFLTLIMFHLIKKGHQNVNIVVQKLQYSLDNPFSLASFNTSFDYTLDTETKHFISPAQTAFLSSLIQRGTTLLESLKTTCKYSDIQKEPTEQETNQFTKDVDILSSLTNSFIDTASIIPNLETILDDIRVNLSDIILFTRHLLRDSSEGLSCLQQAETQFISSIALVFVELYKIQMVEDISDPSPAPSPVKRKSKRHAVRVVTTPQGSRKKDASSQRQLNIYQESTQCIQKLLEDIELVETCYVALSGLQAMREDPLFDQDYNSYCRKAKLRCINDLKVSVQSIRSVSERTPPIISSLPLHLLGNESYDGRLTDRQETKECLPNWAPTPLPRKLQDLRERLVPSNSAIIETLALFQVSVESLLRSFQVQTCTRIDITSMVESNTHCCIVLEHLYQLALMKKQDLDASLPPIEEQMLFAEVFHTIHSASSPSSIQADKNTLLAISGDGSHIVIKFLLASIKEVLKSIEVCAIHVCATIADFKKSSMGIISISGVILMFIEKLRTFCSLVKSYNFAAVEFNLPRTDPCVRMLRAYSSGFWQEIKEEAKIVCPSKIRDISVNMLIGIVTATSAINHNLQQLFVNNYLTFLPNDSVVLLLLTNRMNVPSSAPKNLVRLIHSSVFKFIALWVSSTVKFLDKNVLDGILRILDYSFPINAQTRDTIHAMCEFRPIQFNPSSEFQPWPAGYDLMSIPDMIIAQQITIIDFQLFARIHRREFLQVAWSHPKQKYRAIHLRALIERQNSFAYFVSTCILSKKHKKDRIEIWEKWIQVAVQLEKYQNFSGMMSILAGINCSPVQRLSETKAGVKRVLQLKFESMEALMHPSKSWTKFRQKMASISPPAIPYIGMYLTDLTYLSENKSIINGKINWFKVEKIDGILLSLEQFQYTEFRFPKIQNPAYTWLYQTPYIQEKEAYRISKLREPRK